MMRYAAAVGNVSGLVLSCRQSRHQQQVGKCLGLG